MRFLVDECCPRAVVERLRADGHDIRYAAETDQRAPDAELWSAANDEQRIIITEDFDFGDMVMRDGMITHGVIILFLPRLEPAARAARLVEVLADGEFTPLGALTIVEEARLRRRPLNAKL